MVREMRRSRTRAAGGFTLIEVLIATALLGFSLIVMFGFHAQAARSNLHARKITDCTYLAQTRMEALLSLPWTDADRPDDLADSTADPTTSADPWAYLENPLGGPEAVNPIGGVDETYGKALYFVTWDVTDMDTAATWVRIRVRCTYYDERFNTWRGTTVSSFKYKDPS